MLHRRARRDGSAGQVAGIYRSRPTPRKRLASLACGVLFVALACLLLVPAAAVAMPVQFFYVPFPEDQMLIMMDAINADAVSPITSYITITAVANNTIIYFDQWENGYDIDVTNSYSPYNAATNPGGTQIWGDQNVANGAPPGVTLDAQDVINAGTHLQLSNDVVTTTRQAVIDFDGGDKFAATKTIAMTRSSWAAASGTLFAGCVEVFDTNTWGTDYRAPVGTNATDSYQMFEYTALSIMAGQDGAVVWVDTNNDGDYTDTGVGGDLDGVTLAQGESTYVTGARAGAHVVSSKPVQVDIYTGDIGSNYESRDSALMPTNLWDDSYYTPVSTAAGTTGDARTTAWLYNPNSFALSLAYERRNTSGTVSTGYVSVPAGQVAKQILENATNGTGSHFYATTTGVITFDASTQYSSGTSAKSTSGNIAFTTGSGANRLMLVAVALAEDGTQYNVTSVTYGGTALANVGRLESGAGGNNEHAQVELWALASPASGAANVVVNLAGARAFCVGVTTFTGVDVSNGLTSALGTFASTSGTSGTNRSLNVTTIAGQVVCDVVAACRYSNNDPGAFTIGAGQTGAWTSQTARTANTGFRVRGAGSYETATGTSTTMSWTGGTNCPWAIGAVPIKPATAAIGNFYAYSTTDSASATTTNNQAWDWSYTMIPQSMLTTEALVGLGIGRDPDSSVNPDENGNPVWVTPVGNGETAVTVYVDYDADPLTGTFTDPCGFGYDASYSLKELQQARIYNPSGDQTGMLIYTLGLNPGTDPNANVKLAVAWGQDPLTATASAPGLDCGTSVPPMPEFTAGKDGLLYDADGNPANGYSGDNDHDGYITCGDEIEWPIQVLNVSRLPVPNLVVSDTIPADTTYVAGSTTLWTDTNADGVPDHSTPIADDVVGVNGKTTVYPLDEGGYTYGTLLVGKTISIKFRVVIDTYVNLTPGTAAIMNNGDAVALNWDDPVDDRVYLRARLGDFVWWDENSNGVQDTTEGGIADAVITLYDGLGQIVRDDQGAQITATTDATGAYDFKGLLPGTYIVEFIPPTTSLLTTKDVGNNVGAADLVDSDPDPTTHKTGPIVLDGGEHDATVDAGVIEQSYEPGPTQAVVASFGAYVADGKVTVSWRTASERGTAGFYLERSGGDGWARVNPRMVSALFESSRGGSYAVTDEYAPVGESLAYRLIEVETSGREVVRGPYEVIATSPLPDAGASAQISSGKEVARVPKVAMGDTQYEWRPWRSPVRPTTVTQLRLELTESGLYRVDATDLATGLAVSENSARYLIRTNGVKLTTQGKTVAYLKATDNSALYFYGEAIDSIYAAANVYWLTVAKGTTVANAAVLPPSGGALATFVDTLHAEENLFDYTPAFHDPEADYWLWDYLSAGDTTGGDTQTIDVDVPDVVAGGSLTVSLVSITTIPHANEHHVQISLNGTVLGEAQWSGVRAHEAECVIPAGVLLEGTNQVEVKALLDPGVDHSVVAVESVDITYERATTVVDDALLLTTGPGGSVRVDGLSSADAWVLNVTSPKTPQLLTATTAGGSPGDEWLTFSAEAGGTYLVTTPAAALRPAAITAVAATRFRSTGGTGADYIVITSPTLAGAAARLAAYRATQGLKTMVVTTSEIYDTFNYGIASPDAIKTFISYATTKLRPKPTYVVLAGEGSYDYKNYTGYGDSLVPTLMIDAEEGLVPSDVALADVNGNDGVPELAIGRIPAMTEADLDTALAKIKAYESAAAGAWQRKVLLAADNADEAGNFPVDSDALATALPSSVTVGKAYLDVLGLASARTSVLGGFTGNLLVNYIGHGGVDQWAGEGLLTSADVPGLAASAKLPIVNALTCLVGQYALPGPDSLSENLVKQAGAGAIAVWAPTALEDNDDSVKLGTLFAGNLFGASRSVVLGKVVLTTLRAGAAQGLPAWMLSTYSLLGDPALKVRW